MSAGVVTPIAAAKQTAEAWRAEAERRRRISKHDPGAEVLEYCASELGEVLRPFENATLPYTVAQYAADHGVTEQTVRNWIRRGQLPAVRTPHGWRIPRAARRQRKSA